MWSCGTAAIKSLPTFKDKIGSCWSTLFEKNVSGDGVNIIWHFLDLNMSNYTVMGSFCKKVYKELLLEKKGSDDLFCQKLHFIKKHDSV